VLSAVRRCFITPRSRRSARSSSASSKGYGRMESPCLRRGLSSRRIRIGLPAPGTRRWGTARAVLGRRYAEPLIEDDPHSIRCPAAAVIRNGLERAVAPLEQHAGGIDPVTLD
jgi:hypothetical protein